VRGKGITYDTGFFRADAPTSTREPFTCDLTAGFLPGDRLDDRLGLLAAPDRLRQLLAEGRASSPAGSATTCAPSSPEPPPRASRPRSPSSAAPPTAAPPTWAAGATPSSNGTATAGRGGCAKAAFAAFADYYRG
jgi:hypothetical protein